MADMNMSQPNSLPLRIISLDGGGIRGKSSLLILENIMERIRKENHLDRVPKPCEYFDLIGGTSTGGVIAIMLGRLGMTVDECIRSYDRVAKAAFTPKAGCKLISAKGTYSAKALEKAIKEIVKEFCTEESCIARRSHGHSSVETCPHNDIELRDLSCTKTAVLAVTKDNVDAKPTILSTYDTSTPLQGCSIWQVARATSAATTFFKSIQLGRDKIEFIDAGFGHNNPCEALIAEARQQFPGYSRLLVLSIGTGFNGVVRVTNNLRSVIKALGKMATTSNQVAERMNELYGDDGQYFRFNVDRGLDDITISDWKNTSRVSAHTSNYLNQNQRMIERFVDSLVHDPRREPEILPQVTEIDTNQVYFEVPFPRNRRFVGRLSSLKALERMLFKEQCPKVALVGLGGIGKTQVALQFAFWVKKNKPEYSVFWVPALSNATFEQAYREIAKKLCLQKKCDDEDIMLTVKDHLSLAKSGKWLLIIDNADETELLFGRSGELPGIRQYLPRSDNGHILLTTRFRGVAQGFAETDIVELEQMSRNEALIFLEKSLVRESLHYDKAVAERLVEELSYLPLAIKQAAAYLNTKILPIAEYLSLLQSTKQDMIYLMEEEFKDEARYPDSANAVARTWLVSFDQIRKSDSAATELLEFISCLEPKAIPLSIFPNFEPKSKLKSAIGTLCSYAFLTRRDDDAKTFDMHRLVHLGARIWIQKHDRLMEITRRTIIHLVKVFPMRDFEMQELWQEYAPHVLRVIDDNRGHDIPGKNSLLHEAFWWLRELSQYKESIRILEEVYQWAREQLPENNQIRLDTGEELSRNYALYGNYDKAIELGQYIVRVKQRMFPENNKNRQMSEENLADIYCEAKRHNDAIEILNRIDRIPKRFPYLTVRRAKPQWILATIYSRTGKIEEATEIVEDMLTLSTSTCPRDSHNQLALEHQLGLMYLKGNRPEDSIRLLERVVAVKEKIYPKYSHNRLVSEHVLGKAYLAGNRIKEAIKLLEHVATMRNVLPEDNAIRVRPEYELGRAYLADNRFKEASELLEHVVNMRRKISEEAYPSRLASEHTLARAYMGLGRVQEAIELFEHVAAVDKSALNESDRNSIRTEEQLKDAYARLSKTLECKQGENGSAL
ncbi:acyl transferase/acyl hydrolase/lysophospholipase [Annulohypoxylon moriforme]|nr:acyl transferase/acyl hydrolase/lysophospholipase [Annulohypoxylon moriforme]